MRIHYSDLLTHATASKELEELYKNRNWALLPEDSVVDEYFDDDADSPFPFFREEFPILPHKTFEYRFIPIIDMEGSLVICSPHGSRSTRAIYKAPVSL
ncbi:hypothetical protein CVT24_001744 [Panaeolus cyanescens]|uniref:Uncharacterized protein n=1 Tax=Panaeolus cyanescens TaxID=181874 RepID=A0A409YFR3_9AGAR|nr:hypothetical protein CVT24_001744 [Panaeolus cyanescens]